MHESLTNAELLEKVVASADGLRQGELALLTYLEEVERRLLYAERGYLPVWVVDGKISAVGTQLTAPAGAKVIEANGRWVTPGERPMVIREAGSLNKVALWRIEVR